MFLRILIAIVLSLSPASAGVHGVVTGSTGSSQLNLGGGNLVPANFINVMKVASMTFNAPADAGLVDDDGYLTGSPTGSVNLNFGPVNSLWTGNVQYKLRWDAGVQFSALHINNAISSCVAVNATFTGCSNNVSTVTTTGGAGSLTFLMSATQFSFFYGIGSTNSHSSGALSLYRVSDETDFLAGEIFTPEFKAVLADLNPKTFRTMGWVQRGGNNYNGETTWNYRFKPSTMMWNGDRFPPRAWAGTITGTDQYTSPAAPDTPLGGWVAGEMFLGNVSNPQTARITISNAVGNAGLCRLTVSSTASLATNQQVWINNLIDNVTAEPMTACSNAVFTVTVINATTIDLQGTTFSGTARTNTGFVGTQTIAIAGKSGGAKFISSTSGFPVSTMVAGIGTFNYDAVLDKVIYFAGGIQGSIPVEAMVSITNKTKVNLWANLPPMATDDYVTNWAQTICGSLNSTLYFYPEYSNEIWNFSFPQTQWASQRGMALGWTTGSNQAVYGWYGLRVREVMGNLVPAACSGKLLRRVMAYQGAGDTTNVTNRFNGTQLVPGNAAYNAYTGSANYSALPNRPVDVVEDFAYSAYSGGSNLCTGPDFGITPDATNIPFYQALVTAWEGGDSATSIAMIDNDIRQGMVLSQAGVTASGITFTTPSPHGFTAGGTLINFTVAGGTSYSGVAPGALYRVDATPTTTTFTMKGYVNGFVAGSDIDAGSAGTGTMTVGALTRNAGIGNAFDMVYVANTVHLSGEHYASLYDGNRPGGMANIRIELYEQNLEPKGLTAAQCTSLGITGSNCAASIAAAIIAWKNDPLASATQQAFFSQFEGTDSGAATFGLMAHAKTTSQLVLPGNCSNTGGDYPLLSGCLPNSTPYQLYNGFKAFNGIVH